jgi:hypothetical protein
MPPTPLQWTRLEPVTRTDGLEAGLQANVYDPLWMLARQWQLGEFWGSDGGTAVQAVLRMACTPVTRYAPGDAITTGTVGNRLQAMEPLEMLVERERVRSDSTNRPDLAAEAGLHLLRHIDPTGTLGYRSRLVQDFPLRAAPVAPDGPFASDTNRFLDTIGRRVPDGQLLAWVAKCVRDSTVLASLTSPFKDRVAASIPAWRAWLGSLAAAARQTADTGIATWLASYDTIFSEPGTGQAGASWIPDRVEYAAAVAAPTRDGAVVLAMPEYHGGHLDWYDFDAVGGQTLGATRDDLVKWPWIDPAGETVRRTVIPSPVHFPGMPASRYWEFEDARVDFGAVAAGVQQLAHLLLVEFALVSGDDWFIVPIDMPVGALSQVRWLVVTDSFGSRTLVPSAREVDRAGTSAPLPWDMYRVVSDTGPDISGLFLPPVLGTSLNGDIVEDVALMRDELTNMSWAIERVVESPLGHSFDRAETWNRTREAVPLGASGIDPEAPANRRYRLAIDPPDHWLPLFPTRIDGSAPALHFLRGGTPLGNILEPARTATSNPLFIHDEEVPREGARVTRSFQYARWVDGRTVVWMARRKGAGRGEGSSGLRFDVLESGS